MSHLTQWLSGAVARSFGSGAAPIEAVDDWKLWHAACAGEAGSAAKLVRALTPQAYALAIHLVGRREDAEDAVQEAFLRLWRSTPSDDRGARLSTYFNTIVINRCRSLMAGRREQATEAEALTELQDAQQAAAAQPHAMSGLGAGGPHARLHQGLQRLPARQRMAVAMWAYADAPVAEIARALELDPNAAHQLLHRAKLALRAHLEGANP